MGLFGAEREAELETGIGDCAPQGIGVEIERQFAPGDGIGEDVIGRDERQDGGEPVLLLVLGQGAVVDGLHLGVVAAGKLRRLHIARGHVAAVESVIVEESAVAGEGAVPAPAPGVIDPETALAPDSTPPRPVAGTGVAGVEFVDAVSADAVNAGLQAMAPFEIGQYALLGRPHRREGQILVRRHRPEIRRRHAQPKGPAMKRRQQEAAAALHRWIGVGQIGRIENRNAADLQPGIAVIDRVLFHVVLGLARHDLPQRTPTFIDTGLAGGIVGLFINGDAVFITAGIARGDGDIVGQQRLDVTGEAFPEFIVKFGEIGFEHIAIGFAQHDRAIGAELAALHVVDDAGGGQHIRPVGQADESRGGGDLGLAVKGQAAGHHVDAGALRDRGLFRRHEFG